jgi:hypothetical protein
MIPALRRWVAAAAAAAVAASAGGSPATITTAHEATTAPVPGAGQLPAAVPVDLHRFAWLACRARYRTAAYVLCDAAGDRVDAAGSQIASPAMGKPPTEGR